MSQRPSAVVVLAAGEGTRMKSALPKVLHRILGRPLLGHVLAASAALDPELTVVVVGHGRDAVTAHLTESDPTVRVVVQERQLGTGHAVRTALDVVVADADGPVVVLAGDAPLITSETLLELLAAHDASGSAATVLSARLDDPTGYGRVVRGGGGEVLAIVEQKDADAEQRAIREVSSGVFAFAPRTAARRPAPDRHRQRRRRGVPHRRAGAAAGRRPGRRRGGRGQRRRDPRRQRPRPARAGPGAAARPDRGALDARGRDRRRPRYDLDRRRRHARGRQRRAPEHPAARAHPRRTAGGGRAPTPRCATSPWGGRAGCGAREATEARIGPGAQVGPFSFLRPGTVLAARCQGRRVRRDEERGRRRGLEGAPPVLRRRRDDRRREQHRCRHGLRQLRRRGQAPHRRRRPCPGRQRLDARRPADDRGRRLHGRRLGDHRRRPAGRDGRRSRPPAQRRGLGRAQACRVRGRPRRSARPVPARVPAPTRLPTTDVPGEHRE